MKIVFLNNKVFKILTLLLVVMLCFILIFNISIKAAKHDNVECKDSKDFILAFMNSYIYSALENHFGYQKNFDLFQTEIIDIIDGTYQGYYFDIILLVNSYQGAHLSDFSKNKLTFRLNDKGINLIDFK